ncbi:amphoterin-induced protein 2 isoform 2-T3 [Ara ararauna]
MDLRISLLQRLVRRGEQLCGHCMSMGRCKVISSHKLSDLMRMLMQRLGYAPILRWQKAYPLAQNHYPAKCYVPASNHSDTKIFTENIMVGFGLTI